jgi:hypothetical protein
MRLVTSLTHLGLMVFVGAFTAGCGADCESLCEDAQGCEGALDADCATSCEKTEEAIEEAGCEDQFDDYLDCASDLDDICDRGDVCASEAAAFFACGSAG